MDLAQWGVAAESTHVHCTHSMAHSNAGIAQPNSRELDNQQRAQKTQGASTTAYQEGCTDHQIFNGMYDTPCAQGTNLGPKA